MMKNNNTSEELNWVFKELAQKAQKDAQRLRQSTGFPSLDKLTSGLVDGAFVVIGSRPEMGKTMLALDIADHLAKSKDKATVLFSLELSEEQILNRLLVKGGLTNYESLRSGKTSKNNVQQLTKSYLEKINTFGVVFSVDNMPGADFMTEEGDRNLFTVYNKGCFVSGVEVTSGSIFGIMKEDCDDNAARGEMPIYANAYIIIDGVNEDQPLMAADGVAYSLLDVLKAIDANWDQYVDAGQADAVKTFYSSWAQYGMNAWADKFTNIDA